MHCRLPAAIIGLFAVFSGAIHIRDPAFRRREMMIKLEGLYGGRKRLNASAKNLTCESCGWSSKSTAGLTKHVKNVHERNAWCHYCKMSLSSEKALDVHLQKHLNRTLGIWQCHICLKIFARRQSLGEHMGIHLNSKEFKCSVCERPFNSKPNYIRHMRTHSNMTRFNCTTCGKGFHQKINLLSHGLVHTSMRGFKCKTCGRPFKRLASLKRHMQDFGHARVFWKAGVTRLSDIHVHPTRFLRKTRYYTFQMDRTDENVDLKLIAAAEPHHDHILTDSALPRAKPGSKGKVTVVGVGRLGLCWALNLERVGYEVLGVDIFPSYVKSLNDKTLRSSEPRVSELLRESKMFRASLDLKEGVEFSDCLYLLVQTPSTGGRRHYDTSYVARVLNQFNKMKLKDKHIIIGCTVLPTYCDKVARILISDCKNCTINYNPEFIAQGDIINGQLRPDIVLIGEQTKKAGDIIEEHARAIALNEPKIRRMSTRSAEIAKLSINCFITTKISFANMIGDICDATPGADKFDVLKAVGGDSRIGIKYLKPGFGYGGPCFPRDNIALGGYADEVGVDAKISHATDAYNKYHTKRQARDLLNTGKKAFVISDVAYKEKCPVPIIEESQKLEIARILAKDGRSVTISDRPPILQKVKETFGSTFSYAESV
ncbi:hypothetical protein AAMO2058_000200200 [Amorphochlora amoebiformis]